MILLLIAGPVLVVYVWRRLTWKRRLAYHNLEKMIDAQGPVKFKFREELRNATDRKLGRGGFDTAYLRLKGMGMELAVKQVSTSSNSGEGNRSSSWR
jgi:hypothetical protein